MPLLPFILVLLSAFFHAVWNLVAKKASGNIAVFYVGILSISALLLPTFLFFPITPLFTSPAILFFIATGALHALYLFFLTSAYAHGDISTVYPIARGSSVVGTVLFAIVFLGEGISPIGFFGISLLVGGIILAITRGKDGDAFRAITFALFVGMIIASYSIIDKLGVGLIHPLIYLHGPFLLSMLFLTPYVFLKKRALLTQALKEQKRLSALIGAGSILAYGIILFVFRIADASYVVALREVSIVFASIIGFSFFKERHSPKKIAGIIIIVSGIILIRLA